MTFSIDIHQNTLVKKLKPAVVKVYDYYEPGKNPGRTGGCASLLFGAFLI
jgi:hypothetical protein